MQTYIYPFLKRAIIPKFVKYYFKTISYLLNEIISIPIIIIKLGEKAKVRRLNF